MNKSYTLLVAVMVVCSPYVIAQNIVRLKGDKLPIVCYADHIDHPLTYIGLPGDLQRLTASGARVKTASIEVEYFDFTPEAQAAFDYAVNIWAGLITSPVKIRIAAGWTSLQTGVLGAAGPSFWASNFKGAPAFNVYYPGALAEKLAGAELNNADEYDIVAQFNSSANWYFQTSGNPANGQYDFITVVLHELTHGLGFTGTFDILNGQGFYGDYTQGIPFPYDLALQNGAAQNLYREFDSPSSAMATQLTSNDLYFNSPVNGSAIKLYAPTNFRDGTSIAHLDNATYPQGTTNSLMRSSINMQEVNHDPGPVARNMMTDLGWVITYINHDHLQDRNNITDPIEIKALIKADDVPGYGFDADHVLLVYYTASDATPVEVSMLPTGNADEFSVTLPAPGAPETYYYLIKGTDVYGRVFMSPGKYYSPTEGLAQKGPVDAYYSFKLGPDEEAPVITHTPPPYVAYMDEELVIEADIKESSAPAEVKIEYLYNQGAMQVINAVFVSAEQDLFTGETVYKYKGIIPLQSEQMLQNDKISYRILAKDSSPGEYSAVSPAQDYYRIPVEGLAPSQESYVNNFNSSTDDFISNDFTISGWTGFLSPAMHSAHPYLAAGNSNKSNYITQLRIPIIVKETDAFISFDEVVLVEPGKAGAVFGDPDFYDYVIVEASKDKGGHWTALKDGYNSRDYQPWLTRYNNTVSNVGDQSLYRSRTIDLSDKFTAGDEIVIRFRLYSDANLTGWGWAIDNLNIQGPVSGNGLNISPILTVYPNPTITDEVTIDFEVKEAFPVTLNVLNAQGRLLLENTFTVEAQNKISHQLNVSGWSDGIYFVRLSVNGRNVLRKFMINR